MATFKDWYAVNKVPLSEKRAKRYKEDPEYRAAVIARSAAARALQRGQATPPGYAHHMADTAEALGITIWTLREWRKKNYFPEPLEYKSRMWFTQAQIGLLNNLKSFFSRKGNRISKANKPALDDLVSLIYSNWS